MEVTQEGECTHQTVENWGEVAGKRFSLCVPHFLPCRRYVAFAMRPAAQGAGAGLLSACFPPACSTSARAAPTGRDQNMSSPRLVPLGGQPGPAWNCGSPSLGNVLRLQSVSPGQPARGRQTWDLPQLPNRWMGLGRPVRSGLRGKREKSHRPIFPSGFNPTTVDFPASELSLKWTECYNYSPSER